MTDNPDLLWVDTETFGLEVTDGPIIELGLMLTDIDLNVKASWSGLCWSASHEEHYLRLKQDAWVRDQHEKSGLWHEARTLGYPVLTMLESSAISWIEAQGAQKLPMCGSTVGFDRGQMGHWTPKLEDTFHYRSIDISSLKELCKRLNPEVYRKRDDYTNPKKLHRVLPDLEDSIEEARYYFDNFLFIYP